MPAPSVIIHERLAHWSRQLRPRFRGRPIRWTESRSAGDLARAASRSPCPVLLVDLDPQAVPGLDALAEAMRVAPDALSLVLEPAGRDEVVATARALGATLVLPGLVVPPEVERLLLRWLPIATARSEAGGWSASDEDEDRDQTDEVARSPRSFAKTNPVDPIKDLV